VRKIVFILGGARSGKSTFALQEASAVEGKKAFIATAQALDDEMRLRIDNHKKERGKAWATFEEPLHISQLMNELKDSYDVILIDCFTLWVSNIMHAGFDINKTVDEFINVISQNPLPSSILFQMRLAWALFLRQNWQEPTETTSVT
jgi:adenosyl cobinamide kinase/adenosyl cobinamide phosphate guanylyltransferase